MAVENVAPALSTSSTHIFEDNRSTSSATERPTLSNEQLQITYEIQRTISEIKKEKYKRIALQFPDDMLRDAARVFEALRNGLVADAENGKTSRTNGVDDESLQQTQGLKDSERSSEPRLYILGDTSYGACCVDEVAAEHVNADAVVHYGRACLSPTARLPVIYVFTVQPLRNIPKIVEDFENAYNDKAQKVILMADLPYQHVLHDVAMALSSRRYSNIHEAELKSDPSSALPNRTIPAEVLSDMSKLNEWQIFHISDPPESLLLTLSSRVASIYIHPTHSSIYPQTQKPLVAPAARALNRRYALLTAASTVSVFGILINTLSVRNYLHMVDHVKNHISAAGKKSYTFVVGKVNAAKVANFSEIGAWVVIGCWESSLFNSKDFWKPVITPFELETALKEDHQRVWNGDWSSDYQKLLDLAVPDAAARTTNGDAAQHDASDDADREYDSEPESAPPEFDLRTGRYVSRPRPLRPSSVSALDIGSDPGRQSNALLRRAGGDLAVMGGVPSPGAEFLHNRRTWKGLGSDFEIAYEERGALIEEGRDGIARGYVHRDGAGKV
ncbi:MAG: hypothetical protein Q9163_002141 [Psora crenata]